MSRTPCLPPLGEVAERSEDGEGALSVACGDSSPSGGAKGVFRMLAQGMGRICADTLHSLFYDHPLNFAYLLCKKHLPETYPKTIYFI